MATSRASGLEDPNNPLDPDYDDGENSVSGWFGDSSRSDTGLRVTRKAAFGYTPYFRGLSILSNDTGRCPLIVYKRIVKSYGEGKEKDKKHPAYKLLNRRPNEEMLSNTWREVIIIHACDKGNGYSYIERKAGKPSALRILDPDRTWPVRKDGELYYCHQLSNGTWRKIPAKDMIHIKNFSWDGLSGMGWREIGKETLGMGIASRKFSTRFYRRGAVPSVVLEVPGRMTTKVARQLRGDWESMQSGLENMHRTAVLQQGTKAHVLSQSARDSQMAEMQMFSVRMVAALTGIPARRLGDPTGQGYNSVYADNQNYLDQALDGWLVKLESECQEKLLSDAEKDNDTHVIEFNRKVFVQADMATRYQAYAISKQNKLRTTNEIRSDENEPPVPGGDVLENTAQVQASQPSDPAADKPKVDPASDKPAIEDDGDVANEP